MSYCLKTGGVIYLEAEGGGFECDLHVVGKSVVAVIAGNLQYNLHGTGDYKRVTLRVPARADYIIRQQTPYGFIVAQQEQCYMTPLLEEHIKAWYADKGLRFLS